VVVEGGLGEAEAVGDLLERGAVVPLGGEELQPDLKVVCPRVLAVLKAF
jgi:hypothetical protein